MANNFMNEDARNVSLFDPNYFSRQNDLLNVFKGANVCSFSEPAMLSGPCAYDGSDLFENKISAKFVSEQFDSISYFKEMNSFDKDQESVEATIDNYESSESPAGAIQLSSWNSSDQPAFQPISEASAPFVDESIELSSANPDNRNAAEDQAKVQIGSFEDLKPLDAIHESDPSGKPTKTRKRRKLFSRRKDVIIKTLLRKCRKFFMQDFNAKTNYMKQKRRFTSVIYHKLLKSYLTSVLKVNDDSSLTAFLGAFIYQQDLEDNIESFADTNLSPTIIKDNSDKIHEILYKYSHQKFRTFSKIQDFLPIFMHFYINGSEDLRADPEYSLGLEIIKDQLHSSLQEC